MPPSAHRNGKQEEAFFIGKILGLLFQYSGSVGNVKQENPDGSQPKTFIRNIRKTRGDKDE